MADSYHDWWVYHFRTAGAENAMPEARMIFKFGPTELVIAGDAKTIQSLADGLVTGGYVSLTIKGKRDE